MTSHPRRRASSPPAPYVEPPGSSSSARDAAEAATVTDENTLNFPPKKVYQIKFQLVKVLLQARKTFLVCVTLTRDVALVYGSNCRGRFPNSGL